MSILKSQNPNADLFGVDYGKWNSVKLDSLGIELLPLDIENNQLPFDNESIDLIIANQIMEHTKEVFWINHQIFMKLKIGGYFFLGVPNILSFHNRLLGLLGFHPTQHKSYSAHVRPFSKRDVYEFYNIIGSEFCKIVGFWGSQFYPFPSSIARILSKFFPSSSFSIFFLIKKTKKYKSQFIQYPKKASLETNFFIGDNKNDS